MAGNIYLAAYIELKRPKYAFLLFLLGEESIVFGVEISEDLPVLKTPVHKSGF